MHCHRSRVQAGEAVGGCGIGPQHGVVIETVTGSIISEAVKIVARGFRLRQVVGAVVRVRGDEFIRAVIGIAGGLR